MSKQTDTLLTQKFQKKKITAKGEERAYVDFLEYKNLWFNTGTLCNLECQNCYIESSPRNDRLAFLNKNDVTPYLKELKELKGNVDTLGFTGGEPFLNPNMIDILQEVFKFQYKALILTNGVKVIQRLSNQLIALNQEFPNQLKLRISLDHYTQEIHERERGDKTFQKALDSLAWLFKEGFQVSLAGRSLIDKPLEKAQKGYQELLTRSGIHLKLTKENFVIFPEMASNNDVPEITTQCFDILNVKPENQMCASERMIIKKKGDQQTSIMSCTLLAYDDQFFTGHTLKESQKRVYLNHKFCAEFCILGGASCSST